MADLLDEVAAEQATEGPTCGCSPAQFDPAVSCVRAAAHEGMCVTVDTDPGSSDLVQFVCRDDVSEPHVTV